jgi:O-antigen/teichoic acid export membrane protein
MGPINVLPQPATAVDEEQSIPVGSVLYDSSFYLLGNIVSRTVGFLFIPFYAAFLSPSQYGLIELVELSTQTVAISLGLQAFGAALSRLFYDQPSVERQRAIASTAILATVVLGAVVAAAAIGGAEEISRLVFHTPEWTNLLRTAFAAMFFSSVAEAVLVKERIEQHARFFLRYTLLQLSATLALNLVFIGLLGFGVWGFVCSKLAVTVVGSVYLLARHGRLEGWHWRSRDIPALVAFGVPLTISSASYFAIHFSDRFFLSANVSLADVGRYALAYKIAILVSALIGDSFAKSWETTLYRYLSRTDWREEFTRVASYLTAMLFVTGLAIVMFAPEMLKMMVPRDYYPPRMLLPLLVAAYLAREIGDFFRSLLLINRRPGRIGQIALGGAVLNFAANLVLVPQFGIYGAAYATLLTWVVYMTVCWVVANREHRLPVRVGAYVRLSLMLVATYLLSRQTRVAGLAPDVLLDVFWVVMFAVLTVGTFLTAEERRGAIRLLGSAALRVFMRTTLTGSADKACGAGKRAGPWRLLMLSYYFPPQNEIGAARPDRFARWLMRQGIEVAVVTSAPPRTRAGEEREVDTVHVPGMTLSARAAARWDVVPAAFGVRVAAAAIHLAERLLLPYDDRMGWLPFAYVAASRRIGPGTVLFSTHPPTVTHLTALALKHRFGLPWIADFRDPLWGNPYRTSQRAALIDPAVERLTIEHADAVIANTEAAGAVLRARYPGLADKVHVIWNGFDPEERLQPIERCTQPRRVLVHTGTLYGNRTLLPVMASLHRLIARGSLDPATIQLRQVGRVDASCHDPALPVNQALARLGCLQVIGQNLPKSEARQEMLSAEWLLVLDMNVQNPGLQVPAKVFEYVRTGRPILAFTVPGSSTEQLLALSGAAHVCIDLAAEPEVMDAALLSFIEAAHRPYAVTEAFWQAFAAPSQAQQLLKVIEFASARQAAAEKVMAAEFTAPWGGDPLL